MPVPETEVIVEDGTLVEDANSYMSITDIVAFISSYTCDTNYFSMLATDDKKSSVTLLATRRIERQIKICVTGNKFEPVDQILLFPGVGRLDCGYQHIEDLPPQDYLGGTALYANVISKQIVNNKFKDVREEQGIKRVISEPEEAKLEVEFFAGRSTGFLSDEPEIARLISSAHPPGFVASRI